MIAGGRWTKDFGTSPYLAEAIAFARVDKPLVVQIGAANGDDRAFGFAMVKLLQKAGAGEVLWPRVCGRKSDPEAMREALAKAQVIFVNGGDVEEGMKVLTDLELVADVRRAAARGAACVGISAGAIMLGERWIAWPNAKATDDEAATFECLGIAKVSIDTHGEKHKWAEMRSFVAVRARETGRTATGYGVPSGAALLCDASGATSALGAPVQAFQAKKSEPVESLKDLPVAGTPNA